MQALPICDQIRSSSGSAIFRGAATIEDVYDAGDGIQYRTPDAAHRLLQDRARLSEGAMLLATDYAPAEDLRQHQIVADCDWIHIQFRLSGGGQEIVSHTEVVDTPPKSCVVTRYPAHSTVDRKIDRDSDWKFVCLLMRPEGLTGLLDAPQSSLPEGASWIAAGGLRDFRSQCLPLQSAMALAIHDVLSCSFKGGNRRAYMRAKSLELVSIVIGALGRTTPSAVASKVALSSSDLRKISHAHTIITENLPGTLTLGELARRVGVNRTKLALGFKQLYGTSVQAYWRDARLNRARELLAAGEDRVADIGARLGYREPSSFTRAFTKHFGLSPVACAAQRRRLS